MIDRPFPWKDAPPPRCFPEMLECAERIGVAFGSYTRADFYDTDRGCVFGEFAPTPMAGVGFSAFADEYFEGLWRDAFPDED